MNDKKLILLYIVQILYMFMYFGNGIGYLNVISNNLGYLICIIIAIVSFIIAVIYSKKDKRLGVCLGIISIFEIIFTVFIFALPYFAGIPI